MGPARIYPWRKMHRSRAPSIAPGTFFVAQPWADCITNMPGVNLRQAQPLRRTFGADGKGGWLVDPYSGPGLQVKTCRPSSMRAKSTAATKCPLRRRAVRTGANWNAGGGSIALLLSQTQNIRDEFL